MSASATVAAVLRSGAMLLALVAALAAQAAPVAIDSIAGLQAIRNNLSGDYVLTADIDAAGFAFAPIGPFAGTLDGRGHTIANLTIDGVGLDLVGLFSTISPAATVRNLNFTDAYVTVGSGTPSPYGTGGILAGLSWSRTIDSISASGVLTGRSARYAGGLVGELRGSIANSSTSVIVHTDLGTTGVSFGGLAGYASGDISWSYSTGPVVAFAADVGGLTGFHYLGTISNAYSTSTVISPGGGGNGVGGLVGAGAADVLGSYATGAVLGADFSRAGGLYGYVLQTGGSGGLTGGLPGFSGSVTSSYSTGAVTAGAGSQVGGLVGRSESTIASSYHTGAVGGGAGALVGGVVGKSDDADPQRVGTVVDSYWNVDNAGTAYGNGSALVNGYWEAGTGRTTAQLQSGALPAGFDPSIWHAKAGSYPVLRWQLPSSAPVLVGISSRKAHGAAGVYDLPLTGSPADPTIEPRTGGVDGSHAIVFSFDRAVTGGTVTVTEGTAIAAAPTFSAASMIVPLTGAANAQYVTVKVSNVMPAGGGAVGSGATVRFGLLVGDVDHSGIVTPSDIIAANTALGLLASPGTYLRDVDTSGNLSVSDLLLINANLTSILPAP